ncbi:MBL fold metallo-hydrolase [candidate division KSB1 bacterium]|nr:MBL fold metallo-hydrolase [candidate division KSB1 bacterium]RQW09618.1 MAG: MBL fold metallo-hydrolase [candidate division KSB1 bacterium]
MTKDTINIYPIAMRMPEDSHPAVKVPLMAAVIETANDLIMVDTGSPGNGDFFAQLIALQFQPSAFSLVINTHAHIDHVGNNRDFASARIVASQIDYEHAKSFSHTLLQSDDIVRTLTDYFPHANSRRIEASAAHLLDMAKKYWRDDILGPPSHISWIEDGADLPDYISLLPTPGHTPAHYSLLVHGRNLSFIIAGDAMPSRLFWKRRLRELIPRYDTELFSASKATIEALSGIVMGGHDRPFWTENLSYLDSNKVEI